MVTFRVELKIKAQHVSVMIEELKMMHFWFSKVCLLGVFLCFQSEKPVFFLVVSHCQLSTRPVSGIH